MLNRNKSSLYVGLILFGTVLFLNMGFINAASFTDRLEEMGVDVASFSEKRSVSRYEISRLLNAANCEDCVQAPVWMRQTYSQTFWDSFKARDDKDFDDISYGGAVWNKKSYYYCVAYVGDNGYMAGYPSTSTKCKGKFCGQDSITTSEVYQTILNISQDKIRKNYTVNWREVKSRLSSLKRDGIEMKVLNNTNIKAINSADVNSNIAQTNDEFQAWLKYCMYNLSGCNFQRFGKIGRGYWPVSELNILYKEGIITQSDAMKVAESNSSVNGADALRIFGKVFDNYGNCTFNVDYDCDGITNGKDNCPYMYNQNQYDLDVDGIGNVCDDDIDGDGEKNPEGIVDDNNHIVISLWDDGLDQTPLGNSDLGFSFFINVDAISNTYPTSAKFSVLTNSNIEKIEWDFGDGTTQTTNNGNKLNHTFSSYGTFNVKAVASAKGGGQAFAMTKVFIATPKSENYVLNILPNLLFRNGSAEYTLTPLYSGDLDSISWSVNNSEEKSQKVSEKFKTKIKESGTYVVSAKGYKNGELKAVAMFTVIKKTSPAFTYMTVKPGALWEETEVVTYVPSIDKNNIELITTDRGGEITSSTSMKNAHVYKEAGVKTIQQTVVLKDGTKFYSIATITVQNPLLTQSYGINVSGKRLVYNQNEQLSLGLNTYPKAPVLSLFTSYQAGSRIFLTAPDLAKTILDFSYSTAGDKLLTNTVEINRCVALTNQGTVHINSKDVCKTALENKLLGNYKCDQDEDGVPDICDDDIDGDGMKNLIGIISRENKDCSVTIDNVNVEILKKQFGVCSLDDCPFTKNLDQSDLNNNGIGDACESVIVSIIDSNNGSQSDEIEDVFVYVNDQDQDGVSDNVDQCIDVPGSSVDGCPQYYNQNCWVYSSCGNGKVDEGETCQNCPQDVGSCCGNGILEPWESCRTCPADSKNCEKCGNGIIDEGEDCENCPEDVGKCEGYCGDGIVQQSEDCRNCSEDVKQCVAVCGDGEIQVAEDCKNCKKDVKQCRSSTCGDGRIDKEAGEECDNGKNKNGKDKECTLMCTKYDPNKPKCGNGVIDEGEDCENCPVDLGEKCVKKEEPEKCGNGVIDEGEDCENCPEDVGKCEGYCGDGIVQQSEDCRNCSEDVKECVAVCGDGEIQVAEDCKNCKKDVKQCRSSTCGDGKINKEAGEECDNGKNNGKDKECTLMCTKYDPNKPKCGNGAIDEGEDCNTCSVDLGEKCVKGGDEEKPKDDCTCDTCPETLKDICVTEGDKPNPDCTCDTCPETLKDICVTDGKEGDLCGNGTVNKENGEECDDGADNGKNGKCTKGCKLVRDESNDKNEEIWEISNENCNTCPCEYVDFSAELIKGDSIRAKLWDRPRFVFYKYSNSVSANSFIDND